MDSINQPEVLDSGNVVSMPDVAPISSAYVTAPCPVNPSGYHGPYSAEPDKSDLDGIDDGSQHHWVTCDACGWEASAGADPITSQIDSFYTDGNDCWLDEQGNWHPHDKPPVKQTNGELWYLP